MESRFISPFSITSKHYSPINFRNPFTISSQSRSITPCLLSILRHPDEFFPMLKLKLALTRLEKRIPVEPQHWRFCYSILNKISTSYALVIQELDPDCRDAVCVFYLVLRALDTIEDDTSIEAEVKVAMLKDFHHHIYDHHWQFSCGTMDHKILMDKLHLVRPAFLELELSHQAVIQDVTMRMGAGMAKFIHKEVATVDDYDEYCHYAAGVVGLGLSKLFHACGKEALPPDDLSIQVGLFLQKTNIIQDYLEDINEKPVSRMFWPREIWSKYGNKLEDLKYEENWVAAVQCLNEMVTNALVHVPDCLKCMSTLRDPAILHTSAIPLVKSIGTLALCYDNIQVFRGDLKMRLGLAAKIFDRTRTMSDVYGTFYHFCLVLKSKVDDSDPNARKTKDCLNAIMKICLDSRTLDDQRTNSYSRGISK